MKKMLTRADVESEGFLFGEGLSMPKDDLAHAAHIDLVGGLKKGEMGPVCARTLSDQKEGHTTLQATLVNQRLGPAIVMFVKVTIKKKKQIFQLFADAQQEVVMAFARAIKSEVIPKKLAPQMCFNVGIFIDAAAKDSKLIREHNAIALDLAINNAMTVVEEADMDALVDGALAATHPLLGLSDTTPVEAAKS